MKMSYSRGNGLITWGDVELIDALGLLLSGKIANSLQNLEALSKILQGTSSEFKKELMKLAYREEERMKGTKIGSKPQGGLLVDYEDLYREQCEGGG